MMDKVIDLLIFERERTRKSIEFFENEIKHGKKAIEELQSPEFIEKLKDSSIWNDNWTIQDYIRLNVISNERAVTKYTEKLEEANEYLHQIERALAMIYRYNNAMKEFEGRR